MREFSLEGEVEQISMMKPKAQTEHEEGMLEYLEDIIGSSRYKQPIEECAKSVEELNEARGEKVNTLSPFGCREMMGVTWGMRDK